MTGRAVRRPAPLTFSLVRGICGRPRVDLVDTVCAVALIDRGFNYVPHPHRRISFHSQFLVLGSGLQECLGCALSQPPPVASGLFVIRREGRQIRTRALVVMIGSQLPTRSNRYSSDQQTAGSASNYPQIPPKTQNLGREMHDRQRRPSN